MPAPMAGLRARVGDGLGREALVDAKTPIQRRMPRWASAIIAHLKNWWMRARGVTPPPPEPAPAKRERRGRPKPLRDFPDVATARQALAEALAQQRAGAAHKLANTAQWGQVGAIELSAIRQTEAAIAALPHLSAPRAFVTTAHQALTALAEQFRHNDWDADGYGLGTVHAIIRALEDEAW